MSMKKINKTVARKLYEQKKCFWMVACNLNPKFGLLIDPSRFETTFDNFYNTFIYYNCDFYAGRYPSFYLDESDDESR